MEDHRRDADGLTKAVAWIALLLAIAGLTLGWLAYNQTGTDLEEKIQTQVEQGIQEAGQATDGAGQNIQDAADDLTDEAGDALQQGAQEVEEGADSVDGDTTQ